MYLLNNYFWIEQQKITERLNKKILNNEQQVNEGKRLLLLSLSKVHQFNHFCLEVRKQKSFCF